MTLNFSLQKLHSRFLFGLLLLGIVGAEVWLGAVWWLAQSYGTSLDPQEIERAARLEPTNAWHSHRLGRLAQVDVLHGNMEEAVRHYRRAVELNPHSSTYWMHLAGAYEQTLDLKAAGQAYEKSKVNYPASPRVAWAYGNFQLRTGDEEGGFAEIRRAVEISPQLARLAVATCWRSAPDADRLLKEALPPRVYAYRAAIGYLISQNEVDPARKVWSGLLGLEEPLLLSYSFSLIGTLIRKGRISDAERVWRQAIRKSGREPDADSGNSLVWNGGFEDEPANGGFGWRRPLTAGALTAVDPGNSRQGRRAMKVTFDGTKNVNFQHLAQYVPVNPSTRYRFTAYLRTEEISTDRGVGFRIYDQGNPRALDLATEELRESHPWTRQALDFQTGSETHLIVIALRRAPSEKLDNKIRGTVWVDDVRLTPAAGVVAP